MRKRRRNTHSNRKTRVMNKKDSTTWFRSCFFPTEITKPRVSFSEGFRIDRIAATIGSQDRVWIKKKAERDDREKTAPLDVTLS